MLMSFQLCKTHRWRVRRYRHFDLRPGLNLLIGPNDTGKSTLLHAIASRNYCRRVTPALCRMCCLQHPEKPVP